MFEYVKFNCHVMQRNDVGVKTPETILNDYKLKRTNGVDYIFDGVECVVSSVSYASGKSSIITKILRKGDIVNDNICTEQKS